MENEEVTMDEMLAYVHALEQLHRAAHGCAGTLAGVLNMIDRGEAKLEPAQIVEVIRRDLAEYHARFRAVQFLKGGDTECVKH